MGIAERAASSGVHQPQFLTVTNSVWSRENMRHFQISVINREVRSTATPVRDVIPIYYGERWNEI